MIILALKLKANVPIIFIKMKYIICGYRFYSIELSDQLLNKAKLYLGI